MERFALVSKSFYDPDVLDKKREIDELKLRIKKLENKIGPKRIYVDNYAEYSEKLHRLNSDLNTLISTVIPVTVDGWSNRIGIDFLNALIQTFKNFSISKYDDTEEWALNTAYKLYRNISSFIKSLSFPTNYGWVEFYDANINNIDTIILNFIHNSLWDCEGTGVLQEWTNGIIIYIKCLICNKNNPMSTKSKDICRGCCKHSDCC